MSKGTTDKPMTLRRSVEGLLGPLAAEYARLLDDWAHDAPVQIILGRRKGETSGGYIHQTTMGVLQDIDRAHRAAFEAGLKRACAGRALHRASRLQDEPCDGAQSALADLRWRFRLAGTLAFSGRAMRMKEPGMPLRSS